MLTPSHPVAATFAPFTIASADHCWHRSDQICNLCWAQVITYIHLTFCRVFLFHLSFRLFNPISFGWLCSIFKMSGSNSQVTISSSNESNFTQITSQTQRPQLSSLFGYLNLWLCSCMVAYRKTILLVKLPHPNLRILYFAYGGLK